MKNRSNINLACGFVTPLHWVAPASQRVRHLALGRRWLPSHFMDLARDVPTSLHLGRSGSRWAQSGYATSLREVAFVQSGCHTSLQWVAPVLVGPKAGTLPRCERSLWYRAGVILCSSGLLYTPIV
ncbi:hypothetical protein F2Q70_00010777 [Brassica cretica]|uniref:Uncharacterized protein n=1 Tax=Brassica cretica TaxID=69181 RepID=A0A8S9LVK7_BRACR|nr:hypothetical protein F2Q70_00010777 [Brassica cretica]